MAEGDKASDLACDTSALPEQYLDAQASQFNHDLDVLIICNLIFNDDRVLLYRTAGEPKSWKDKVGVPMFRLRRATDDSGLEGVLKSKVDQVMSEDVSVEEYARVACRVQVGLDPARLQQSSSALALHTAVSSPLIEDSVWLRASLMWKIEDGVELKPDGHVCQETFWASSEAVEKLPEESFLMGIKPDIQTALELRKRRLSLT
ncbi:hypothetical protein DOTSEDRAFT_27007 [Dothistroma septosporum NZE10]|uniref:Nudix hydrolase domain-containing protein n=1 Tax=Dothistroma septosporum (strain NZE10 / CBS 128990) TaxID=675120 RepID=N1PGZ9_DOTSN|nr:hypothetical protein DOTSEDRAFT_27007 [Dothistroma septosporum NZE10]